MKEFKYVSVDGLRTHYIEAGDEHGVAQKS